MTTRTDERVAVFRAAVSSESIDFRQIRDLAFQGIPDAPALRSVYWKLLLSYLPNDRAQWPALLDKSRAAYRAFVSELVIDPHRADHADQPAEPDHPLSTSASSTWNAFFKDGEIIEEIDKGAPLLHLVSVCFVGWVDSVVSTRITPCGFLRCAKHSTRISLMHCSYRPTPVAHFHRGLQWHQCLLSTAKRHQMSSIDRQYNQ
eukprot:TRINITY_DN3837_c0_g1_i5.p1 TRINITY_DN3837_c0_g1~~TRINITY_DN3837_c0_g1_i5.p1  ORF type:complete len:203 (-),score=5.47 TRINITY_DN3837_c0_g1_i5:400-1008(-)